MILFCVFFFFQAEDGIRDAQESRGLGDVYKRQGIRNALEKLRGDDCLYVSIMAFDAVVYLFNLRSTLSTARMIVAADLVYDTTAVNEHSAVSYTHLTLPTKRIV
eukprot:TRINITY_DN24353_c0_g1_i2.p1 TRINITY_DN24353_c0_g1~~TRINITY_DN24353_c0_g1_i2.p1  ORF type:complete len:105 (+),score=32.01 TRINITY_DN24353_c0_g1_i2:58-372(+)